MITNTKIFPTNIYEYDYKWNKYNFLQIIMIITINGTNIIFTNSYDYNYK